ncbi:uncharacterized protein [Anoplolepis gracilipes]|uniref:uncharacterized protein n=1 Tax=Anoplolepis gracilipes TaxID=354296 RepID=UPI003BA0F389
METPRNYHVQFTRVAALNCTSGSDVVKWLYQILCTYPLSRDFNMGSTDEEAHMEFVFDRKKNSTNEQEKVKAFWKFLESQNLEPHKGISEYESSSEAESSMSNMEKVMKEKDIWRKGLKVFQQLGLDKTARAAAKKCRPCQMHRTIRCKDLADTVTQPYEELNADMKAFDERQKSHGSNQCDTPYAGDRLNQCNSYYAKTKK